MVGRWVFIVQFECRIEVSLGFGGFMLLWIIVFLYV